MIGRRGFLQSAAIGLTALRAETLHAQEPPASKAKPKTKTKSQPKTKPTALEPDETITRLLAPIRDDHHLPGLIGAIVVGDTLSAIGAVGLRKVGSAERFRIDDKVHLGSDTKAMTATLLGMIVEEGKLTWKTTLGDVFPNRVENLATGVASITLIDLLTHRAGLSHDPAMGWWNLPGQTPTEQRFSLLGEPLMTPLLSKPGTKYEYSNFGYVLAGLMAEQVTRTSWETLMRERIFKPLEMASADFGPPGRRGQVLQPWGHELKNGTVVASQFDNPPSMGPAGTVHCSVADWGKFASLHLLAAEGKPRLLKASTFKTLHTSPPGQNYAAGWGVTRQSSGNILAHDGSNTTWYCSLNIVPSANLATLVATNFGSEGAGKACVQATQTLLEHQIGKRPRRR